MTTLLRLAFTAFVSTLFCVVTGFGAEEATRDPILRTVDLDIGQSAEVTFANNTKATVKLLEMKEPRDSMSNAVRDAKVRVEVNGQSAWIAVANYNLPVTIGGVQIDCTITKGYNSNANGDP